MAAAIEASYLIAACGPDRVRHEHQDEPAETRPPAVSQLPGAPVSGKRRVGETLGDTA